MIEWRTVKTFPLLEVSNTGLVREASSKRLLHQSNSHGYKRVYTKTNGKRRDLRVHILVATAFLGEGRPGQLVRHRDDNKANNHVDNLRWGSHSDNHLDSRLNGTASCDRTGKSHPRKRSLSEAIRNEAYSHYQQGETIKGLAKRYGVHYQTMRHYLRSVRKIPKIDWPSILSEIAQPARMPTPGVTVDKDSS